MSQRFKALSEYLGVPQPFPAQEPLDVQQSKNESAALDEMNPLEKFLAVATDTPNKQWQQRKSIPK